MKPITVTNATILGLLAAGALSAGCSSEAPRTATPVSTQTGEAPASGDTPGIPPVSGLPSGDSHGDASLASNPTLGSRTPVTGPVDAATAKAAWSEGVALYGQGDYVGAASQLQVAVAGHPDDPYRRYLLGLALWKSGQLDEAEASLVESSSLDPKSVKTWVNLARVRNEKDDREGALQASLEASKLDPESSDALHQQGRALMELGRTDEALAALTSARGLDPDNGWIANTLGLLLVQAGRSDEAIEPLVQARALLPDVPFVRNNLGVAYERIGRMDEARVEYQAAVQAGDKVGKAAESLARLGTPVTPKPDPTQPESTVAATVEPSGSR